MRVRTSNDILRWITFFLVAATETSKEGISTFRQILKLREDVEGERLIALGKKISRAKELLKYLYKSPAAAASNVGMVPEVTPATAEAFI